MKNQQIICTLGPSSLNDFVIERLTDLGVSLLRINLSHTALEDVADVVQFVLDRTEVPLCLDTEGAQVRTGSLAGGKTDVSEHRIIEVPGHAIAGSAESFNLYPENTVELLEVGDLITIDFNAVLVQVIEKRDDGVTLRVINGGTIGQNKAVTVGRGLDLPPLTEKDRKAVVIGHELGVRHFALSFANRAEDVDLLQELVGDSKIIAKIESLNGIRNMEAIGAKVDALLIDRGDLSREMPIQRIPGAQKKIIDAAKKAGTKVYVATNLLETMVDAPEPTRAEVNDIYNTLKDGADGLVLAAETAIGNQPVACAAMVRILIREFNDPEPDHHHAAWVGSMLNPPLGGYLIDMHAAPDEAEEALKGGLRSLPVGSGVLCDCEQIAEGTYSPLLGFMDRDTLASVLDTHRLPDGTVWPLPIILQVDGETAKTVNKGERIVLTNSNGAIHSLLQVSDVYPLELDAITWKWFGSTDAGHPGIKGLASKGDFCLAGEIRLIERRPSQAPHSEFTPSQSRSIFTQKSWSRVVGFHSRSLANEAHQHIQLEALAKSKADGLFINPMTDVTAPDGARAGPILDSYQLLLDKEVYPPRKTVIGVFSSFPRFSGPRETVFHALCRKNMGCSHFIFGCHDPDAGEPDPTDATKRLLDHIGGLGIEPVFGE